MEGKKWNPHTTRQAWKCALRHWEDVAHWQPMDLWAIILIPSLGECLYLYLLPNGCFLQGAPLAVV